MFSSIEDDLPHYVQLCQILQKFYSKDGPDEVFRLSACTFFEKTVEKTKCVAAEPSVIPPPPPTSCLAYCYYSMIKQLQEDYVENLHIESLDFENEDLLNFLVDRWTIFECGSIKLDSACEPLYLHFSKLHPDLTTIKVYVHALTCWHSHCSNFTAKAIGIVMEMIDKERRGELINTELVRQTMKLLVHITDLIERDSHYGTRITQPNLLSEITLQTEFIYHRHVCRFYRVESIVMLLQYTTAVYITKAKDILADEYKKCKFVYCMPHHIAQYIQLSLSEILIEDKKSVLIPDFMNALTNYRFFLLEDVCFILRNATPDLLNSFCKAFYDSVALDGKTMMQKHAEKFLMQPELYITIVLQIMNKYTAIVRVIFDDDDNFKKANEEALSFILNHSFPSDKMTTSQPAEYLAIYCDSMLRKSEADTAYSISQLSCLFQHLENKHLFEETFYELLVKSLICATTINEKYENDILSFVETFRKGSLNFITEESIRDMIKDIRTSKDLTDMFATQESIHSVDSDSELVVKVLKGDNWPLANENFAGALPKSLSVKIDSFYAFHMENYPYRELTFLYKISQAEVITHCFGKKYILRLNINQLILLLQFNKAESWSIKQLLEDTKIEQKSFNRVIQNFIEAGILKYKEDDDADRKASVIMLNLDYENHKDCVSFSSLKDGIQEAMKAPKKRHDYVISEESICLAIQAAIVRIIKKELLLEHEELVTRTFETMKTKFDFTLDMVNKSIDKLIQNEYIERSHESERHYVYIP